MTEATRKKSSLIAIVICGIIAAIGIGLWIFQMKTGLGLTGMRNLNSWGLYITYFMFLVGLSAGGLIISSIPRAFGIAGFGGISKVAVWTSICCTVLAIGFVVIDMGQPLRVWELFVYSNLGSPLMWDIIVLFTYLILSIVYLWFQISHEEGKTSDRALRVISIVALVIAVLVHSVTAWIFGLQASHEFWHTALLAPWFVVSALVSGLALVILVVVALAKTRYLEVAQENIVKMAKILGILVIVDLYFLGCDLLTAGFPQASGAHIVAMLTAGVLAPYFWGEVICGVLSAAICFIPKLRTTGFMAAASILAIAGIFLKRFQLLMAGFQTPNLDYAGIASNLQLTDVASGYSQLIYAPTAIEWGIVIGVFALGGFMFLLGLRKMNLSNKKN